LKRIKTGLHKQAIENLVILAQYNEQTKTRRVKADMISSFIFFIFTTELS